MRRLSRGSVIGVRVSAEGVHFSLNDHEFPTFLPFSPSEGRASDHGTPVAMFLVFNLVGGTTAVSVSRAACCMPTHATRYLTWRRVSRLEVAPYRPACEPCPGLHAQSQQRLVNAGHVHLTVGAT